MTARTLLYLQGDKLILQCFLVSRNEGESRHISQFEVSETINHVLFIEHIEKRFLVEPKCCTCNKITVQ